VSNNQSNRPEHEILDRPRQPDSVIIHTTTSAARAIAIARAALEPCCIDVPNIATFP